MKKVYEKPEILFESFSLSTSISKGCEIKTDSQSYGVCTIGTGEIAMFDGAVPNCVYTPGEEYDGPCYHVPIESENLFNS